MREKKNQPGHWVQQKGPPGQFKRNLIYGRSKPLLRNPNIFPSDEELEIIFGKKVFRIYNELMNTLTGDKFRLTPEWNYYKDGKAWLCNSFIRRKPYFGFPFGRIPLKLFFILPKKRARALLKWT